LMPSTNYRDVSARCATAATIARKAGDKIAAMKRNGYDPNPDDVATEREKLEVLARLYTDGVTRRVIVPRLNRYRAPTFPVRPASFPDLDGDLVEAVKQAKAKTRPTYDEKRFLERFGAWRSKCLELEGENRARIVILLKALWRAETCGADDVAFDLRSFLANEHGAIAAAPTSYAEAESLSERLSRRRDVISDEVLFERKVSAAFAARSEPEDASEQVGFSDVDDMFGV